MQKRFYQKQQELRAKQKREVKDYMEETGLGDFLIEELKKKSEKEKIVLPF